MKNTLNFGTLVDPDKYYPVTYSFNQDGKKIFKKGKLKGCDLTENQVKEILRNPRAKIIISHGGTRSGSGRPKLKSSEKKEPTKVMRIPDSKVDEVKKIIKKS